MPSIEYGRISTHVQRCETTMDENAYQFGIGSIDLGGALLQLLVLLLQFEPGVLAEVIGLLCRGPPLIISSPTASALTLLRLLGLLLLTSPASTAAATATLTASGLAAGLTADVGGLGISLLGGLLIIIATLLLRSGLRDALTLSAVGLAHLLSVGRCTQQIDLSVWGWG